MDSASRTWAVGRPGLPRPPRLRQLLSAPERFLKIRANRRQQRVTKFFWTDRTFTYERKQLKANCLSQRVVFSEIDQIRGRDLNPRGIGRTLHHREFERIEGTLGGA
jgi:hypothetical protein